METINNYLNTMFLSLPDTPEVRRAKQELEQMMEDKYTELRNQGKTENEAVGTVISEFGNLNDLAESLGIYDIVKEEQEISKRTISLTEAQEYLQARRLHGLRIALAVALFILSPCGSFFSDATTMFLFPMVAIGVGLCIFSSACMGKWKFLQEEPCQLDPTAGEMLRQQEDHFRIKKAAKITIGVILCIISVMPSCMNVKLIVHHALFSNLFLFAAVAAGVFLFVSACYESGAYEILMGLNQKGTMGAIHVQPKKLKVHYRNKTAETIMALFWFTVTCLYLSVSFLTFQWQITWIIWVLAALIHSLLTILWKE